jgi:phosphohistidine phosphatase
MKTLLLMRHAKSSWDADGISDHDRPLNARGERSAPAMAELVVQAGLAPRLILSSTALRARETAFAVARAFGWKPEVRLVNALYMAEPRTILAQVAALSDEVETVLVVGHNPGMEELVSDLGHMRQHMPTAAVARFDVAASHWAELADAKCELVHVWRPKELD